VPGRTAPSSVTKTATGDAAPFASPAKPAPVIAMVAPPSAFAGADAIVGRAASAAPSSHAMTLSKKLAQNPSTQPPIAPTPPAVGAIANDARPYAGSVLEMTVAPEPTPSGSKRRTSVDAVPIPSQPPRPRARPSAVGVHWMPCDSGGIGAVNDHAPARASN